MTPTFVRDLLQEVHAFIEGVYDLNSPDAILAALDAAIEEPLRLAVMAAARVPNRSLDWPALEIGQSAFIGPRVPRGFIDEYRVISRQHIDPELTLATMSLAPLTLTETLRLLRPTGVDRWPHDLSLKYGIRDGFYCPIGNRWMIAFWSPRVLGKEFGPGTRALLVAASQFAAIRLEQILPATPGRIGDYVKLTPRELAVARHASVGQSVEEMAKELDLGVETVRTYSKNLQRKLEANNITQAVAEAIRLHLIP